MPMPGDAYFTELGLPFVAMTRGISITAPPANVWPWLAQLGRGAGWYSLDGLDNGGRTSARHIVSWIPSPRIGDASAIGYLRHVRPGSELTWWVPGTRFLRANAQLAVDIRLREDEDGARLVIRNSATASGRTARISLRTFELVDSIMARRQLLGIKERAERCGRRHVDPENPETGSREQYQLYEIIYADGDRAGTPDREEAAHWRQAAIEAGLIATPPDLLVDTHA